MTQMTNTTAPQTTLLSGNRRIIVDRTAITELHRKAIQDALDRRPEGRYVCDRLEAVASDTLRGVSEVEGDEQLVLFVEFDEEYRTAAVYGVGTDGGRGAYYCTLEQPRWRPSHVTVVADTVDGCRVAEASEWFCSEDFVSAEQGLEDFRQCLDRLESGETVWTVVNFDQAARLDAEYGIQGW